MKYSVHVPIISVLKLKNQHKSYRRRSVSVYNMQQTIALQSQLINNRTDRSSAPALEGQDDRGYVL